MTDDQRFTGRASSAELAARYRKPRRKIAKLDPSRPVRLDANHTVETITDPVALFMVWSRPVRLDAPSGDLTLVFRTRDSQLALATYYQLSGWSVWIADPGDRSPYYRTDIPGRA